MIKELSIPSLVAYNSLTIMIIMSLIVDYCLPENKHTLKPTVDNEQQAEDEGETEEQDEKENTNCKQLLLLHDKDLT